jgi:hypothetical protein
MQTNQTDVDSGTLAPVAELRLVDREQLRVSLRPTMRPGSWSNWLMRAMRDHGFPEPIRTGSRSCAWRLHEVAEWIESRPRKGVFAGRRRG